jgi:hypothetical protein
VDSPNKAPEKSRSKELGILSEKEYEAKYGKNCRISIIFVLYIFIDILNVIA